MAWEMMLLNNGSKGEGGRSSYLHLGFVLLPIRSWHSPLPPTPALVDHITHGFFFFFLPCFIPTQLVSECLQRVLCSSGRGW